MYKKGTMPSGKQITTPGSAPGFAKSRGGPPERISGPNRYDVPKAGYPASYRQRGRRGGND